MAAFHVEELTKVAAAAIEDHIRKALRARILEKIEPDIEASIEAVMETFRLNISTWKDFQTDGRTIGVLIEDRREGKG